MSHIVSFNTSVTEAESVEITAKRLKLPKPEYRTNYRMRSGKVVKGIAVQLQDWQKPVIFDTETGRVEFDNWSPYDEHHPAVRAGKKEVGDNGKWGDIAHLHRFVDEYVATGHMLQAKEEGHIVEECSWDAETESVRLLIQS